MYRACMVPIMTYASPIWWTGKKTHGTKLGKVQNDTLRHMAGAFRTTPTHALEIDIAVPPIELTMEMTAEGYANRLHRLRHTNPVIDHLPDEWQHGSQMGNPPPLPPRTKAQVKKGTKLTQLKRTARLTY
ncbi:hypothetical protein J132_00086 [Termitomyces sp. J132]|nr:hypothetical protein J132_00086 [Termitomyces sp. J132]